MPKRTPSDSIVYSENAVCAFCNAGRKIHRRPNYPCKDFRAAEPFRSQDCPSVSVSIDLFSSAQRERDYCLLALLRLAEKYPDLLPNIYHVIMETLA